MTNAQLDDLIAQYLCARRDGNILRATELSQHVHAARVNHPDYFSATRRGRLLAAWWDAIELTAESHRTRNPRPLPYSRITREAEVRLYADIDHKEPTP